MNTNTSQQANTFMIFVGIFVIIGLIVFALTKFFTIYGGASSTTQANASLSQEDDMTNE